MRADSQPRSDWLTATATKRLARHPRPPPHFRACGRRCRTDADARPRKLKGHRRIRRLLPQGERRKELVVPLPSRVGIFYLPNPIKSQLIDPSLWQVSRSASQIESSLSGGSSESPVISSSAASTSCSSGFPTMGGLVKSVVTLSISKSDSRSAQKSIIVKRSLFDAGET